MGREEALERVRPPRGAMTAGSGRGETPAKGLRPAPPKAKVFGEKSWNRTHMQLWGMSARGVVFPALALLYAGFFSATESWIERVHPSMQLVVPLVAAALIIGSVFAALEYAEVVGARVGEPLGTLVLTASVTIIEVAILGSMVQHGTDDPTEAREAIFSTVMIVCNGVVGLCLLLGGFRHGEQELQTMGARAYLAVLIALSILTLVIPNYTVSSYGPTLAPAQLVFISVLSILLYGSFLFIQTVRHRSYFLDTHLARSGHYGETPSTARALAALVALCVSLLGVSLLAERFVPALKELLSWTGVSEVNPIAGAAVALLVLLPETLNAIRAARRNALQTSLNAALGSAVSTIGLTVPAVALISLATGRDLIMGLEPRDAVMLIMTLMLSVVSFGAGRTNAFTGLVHLVVFATYGFFLFVP
ncbi:sodium/calcium exchanger membrane protein [Methylocystis echinoides]|uniref:Sodium/calcium exchanger membrane protein n=2 Tax=Methylocystis echinoides TaxID=29468 RepID=A0A9W6LRX9_9HYPH|nr:sodium/calcium exchanger membrane protein [Methylocystis echinoides]